MSSIPRKAPNTVVEQRVTLGQFERAQLNQALQLAKRQQAIDGVTNAIVPLTLVGGGLAGVYVIAATWEKVNDLIPNWDGLFDGFTKVVLGSKATEEAILKEAAEEAANDGKPLPFWKKAFNRFASGGLGAQF